MSDDNLSDQGPSNEAFEDANHDEMFEMNPNMQHGYFNIAPPHYSPGMMPQYVSPYMLQFQQPLPPTQSFSSESIGSEPDESINAMYYPPGGNIQQYHIEPPSPDANDDDNDDNDEKYQPNEDSYDDPMIGMMYGDQPPIPMYDGPMQPPMGLYDQASMDMDYMPQPPPYYFSPMDQAQAHGIPEFPTYGGEEGFMHHHQLGLNMPEQQQKWEDTPSVEPETPRSSSPRRKGAKKGRVAKTPKPRKTGTRKRGGPRKRSRQESTNEDVAPPVELPTGFDQVLQRAASGPADNDAIEIEPEMDIKPQILVLKEEEDAESADEAQSPDSDTRESSYDPPRRRDYRRCETKVMLQTVDGHLFNKYYEEEDIRDFARRFKTLRCEFGFSQADVGAALGRRYGSDFSQTTISRFEGLVLSHTNMCKLRPPIEQWIADVQSALDSGIPIEQLRRACKGGDFWPAEQPPPSVNAALVPPLRKRRKRTSLDASQRLALESYFEVNLRPDNAQMSEISRTLELGFDVVRVWFCNRRQKARKDEAKVKARLARASGSLGMDVSTPSPTPSQSNYSSPRSDALDDEDETFDDEPLEEESVEEPFESKVSIKMEPIDIKECLDD